MSFRKNQNIDGIAKEAGQFVEVIFTRESIDDLSWGIAKRIAMLVTLYTVMLLLFVKVQLRTNRKKS